MAPIPWLLTFTCYGTWLPGDPRGSTDRVPGGGSYRHPPRALLHSWAARRMVQPPFLLDVPARAVVGAAIRNQCIHAGWVLHALHVGTNHLHVVLSGSVPPERMMGQMKSWATRRLREAMLIDADRRVWARHGSTVPLRTVESVQAACRYVAEGQGVPSGAGGGRGSEGVEAGRDTR